MSHYSEEWNDERQERHAEMVKQATALDHQEGGDHYKNKPIQPVEYILANGLGFCEGNVVKYVSRHKEKGGKEDLKKAIHYIELLMGNEYNGSN